VLKHLFLFAFLFCRLIVFSVEKNDTTVIGFVNGEPLVFKELRMSEMKCRISANDSNSQQQKAFKLAVLIKLQQQIAKETGLIHDISYTSFLIDFQNENIRRKMAIQNNEVLYGPVQFTEENYFDYKLSNLILKLKEKLSIEKFEVSDIKLMDFYETVKDSLYKIPDYYEVERFDLIINNAVLKVSTQHKITNKLQTFKPSPQQSVAILKKWLKNYGKLTTDTLFFNPLQYQMAEGEGFADLENQLENKKAGTFSKPVFQNKNISFFLIIKRQQMGFRKFESVKNSLKTAYNDFLYKKFLSEKLKKAIIVRY
jgi:hypothetical protein